MKGSNVNNIKVDVSKQKIVECSKCGAQLVVNKFSKKGQTCESINQFPPDSKCSADKKSSARDKISKTKESEIKKLSPSNFIKLMNKLEFDIDEKRRFKKKYAIDGGGIFLVYPQLSNPVGGEEPKIEYFSIIIQRVVGTNENFRDFMPSDAASDCEIIADEFSDKVKHTHNIGYVECDNCHVSTAEFGVDPKRNKVYCIKPNNCFKKVHNNAHAESVE